jgi:hypothetical protein
MKTKQLEVESREPRILFLDIETAPDVTWAWGVYQENAIAVKEHWYVLSYAAQWRGSGPIVVRGLDDFPGYRGGNSTEAKLIKEVRDLLDRADIVVAHNGVDFDVRKLNARMIAHRLPPPSPYRIVDTKRDLTRVAKFSSNRLNWLSKQLGIGRKTEEHHDWKMWQGCMEGDAGMWRRMKTYNRHDVVLLRELYERLAPWLDQPNAAAFARREVCPNPACRKPALVKWGFYRAKTRIYQRYSCRACGAWARASRSVPGGATIVPVNKRFA